MALPILDGNQSATTLSSILTSGEHIPAHTVVSLGTQAITDISGAVSGSVVSISNFPATQTIAGTVTASLVAKEYSTGTFLPLNIAYQEELFGDGARLGVSIINDTGDEYGAGNPLPISGTVTANVGDSLFFNYSQGISDDGGSKPNYGIQIGYTDNADDGFRIVSDTAPLPISGTVTVGNTVTIAGTVTANPTGTQTIAGSVTIGAGTSQIGSVTASISGTVPVSGTFFQATQPVSLTTLPALVAGTAQIGSVTASISGTVPISISSVTVGNSVTIGSLPALAAGTAQIGSVTASLAISSSAITSGSFTSLASATLVPANTARKMATVYNLGAGQLFINAGATATTLGGGFMVALSSGDFYECDYTTTTLSAIFATAGTASWVSH